MKTIGIDLGSSSVKVSMLDCESGNCIGSLTLPEKEMTIESPKEGWAEQDPALWWRYIKDGIKKLTREVNKEEIAALGITYQMHGLVCLNSDGEVLRKSIIWCDSRAVEIGAKATEAIGAEICLEKMLNYPGNFTASKLAWVKENEAELYSQIDKFMLPGDYILYKLSGEKSTTMSGLSEQILWDFSEEGISEAVTKYYGIGTNLIPNTKDSIGVQASISAEIAKELGLKEGTPITYRAGDQPNNAFSLNVMEPGEIAATGGTSGVVYGITNLPKADLKSRVNTFLHVNHSKKDPKYGVLLCINGTGILNAWCKRLMGGDLSYAQINELCESVPAGSDGVTILPFGNGAERMLENRYTGTCISNINLNRHDKAHLLRAAQEGIAFAFKYGIDIMKEVGLNPQLIRAGHANLFLSPLFRETLSTICNASIELYDTDGALGAARGAALGAGIYKNREEAFENLKKIETIAPNPKLKETLNLRYEEWKKELENKLHTK